MALPASTPRRKARLVMRHRAGRITVAYYPPGSTSLRRTLARASDPVERRVISALLVAAGVGR